MNEENKQEVNPNYVQPDLDTFREDLKEIYAEGDTHKAWLRLCWYLQHVKFENKWMTYEWIMHKYRQHIDWWNQQYGTRAAEYIASKDREKRKNFHDFLGSDTYKHDFSMKIVKLRDKYLFPENVSTKELKKKLERFREKYL